MRTLSVDLGERSFFSGSGLEPSRFRGADYDPGPTALHHMDGRNEYLLSETVLQADLVGNLPKLKTHFQLYMTGAVKNLFGYVAGKRKAWWHFKAGSYRDYFPLMLVETARLLGPRLADRLTAPILRRQVGRPEDYGLNAYEKGPATMVAEDGRIPMIDVGALAAIREGRIRVAPGIARLDGAGVAFTDGTVHPFDTIIAATGYTSDLRPLFGPHCAALDDDGQVQSAGVLRTARKLMDGTVFG